MGRVAILCGGQGAQAPGMADALGRGALVDEVFEAASDVCGFDVRAACGDASALADAERVQPALCAVSIASARLAQSAGVELGYVAGFSLGQVAALNVAGMLSLEQTFSLCSARARAMAKAAEKTPGAMCALSGADEAAVEELIERTAGEDVLVAANFNAPGQIVVSGHRAAVERAAQAWRARPRRRATMLAVAGAFHSPLMQDAARDVAAFLADVRFGEPRIPLVCNVDARPLSAQAAPKRMARQIVSPVLFDRSIAWLSEQGVDVYVECGSGSVLCSLVRRISPSARRFHAASPDEARAAAGFSDGEDELGGSL